MTHRNVPFLFEHRFRALLQRVSGEAIARRGGDWVRALSLLASLFGIALFVEPAMAQTEPKPPATYPALPSEIPAKFEPTNDGFDYVKRDVMIPMRDGVKLHTVILIPKGAKRAPILLTRTPYDADKLTSHAESAHLGPVLNGYDNALDVILEGGYLRVVQDVRGKHGSEGDYVVNRPLRGPQNPTPVDHATDTWDTIDWLVKNVPESNGKVGILGISYDGFLPLMALVDPHPALKVSVPMNPMVDGWIGDDWFHYGAFRQINVSWIYNQVATRKSEAKWWTSHHDDYDMFMQAGSAGELGRRRGLDQLGFWRKLTEHPTYDAFWRDQAVDKLLAAQPLKVPVMLVHSLWDQEDIYGAPAVYKAIEPKDTGNDKVFLVIGPWHHGQMIGDGSSLGAVKFGSDTALYFRQKILRPFLDQYLKDGAPKADIAPVTAFETGTNAWRRLSAWPPESGRRQSGPSDAALSSRRSETELRGAGSRRCGVRGVRLRSRQAGPLSRTPHSADGLRAGQHLVAMARRRPARGLRTPGCRGVHLRHADRADEDQRRAHRQPGRLHERHRRRLGGQADRRLSRRGRRRRRHGRLSAHDRGRHLSRPIPRELRDGQADRSG